MVRIHSPRPFLSITYRRPPGRIRVSRVRKWGVGWADFLVRHGRSAWQRWMPHIPNAGLQSWRQELLLRNGWSAPDRRSKFVAIMVVFELDIGVLSEGS